MAVVLEAPDVHRLYSKIKPHLSGDDLVNAELIKIGLLDLIGVFEKIDKHRGAIAC